MILLSFECDETGRGKTAAFKMKTLRSYSEVPRWKLICPGGVSNYSEENLANIRHGKTVAPLVITCVTSSHVAL